MQTNHPFKFHVIIPAAGSGSRMQSDAPKQYLKLHSQPLIQHVLKVFDLSAKITSIHVVLSPNDTHWHNDFLHTSKKISVHYVGGETRAQTVLNALNAMTVDAQDWVLVHDAARPGLSNRLLSLLINTLEFDAVGGLLALPLADTLKRADTNNCVETTISREALWQAQTPQMFKYGTLKTALESYAGSPTDEAQAIEALGLKPKLVTGELQNMKVTYPQDLAVLTALLKGSV